MACFRMHALAYQREFQADGLVSFARTIVYSLANDTQAMDSQQRKVAPEKIIELCTEAVELSPSNGEAYHLRAFGYERLGDADNASADRLRAKEHGYISDASSGT